MITVEGDEVLVALIGIMEVLAMLRHDEGVSSSRSEQCGDKGIFYMINWG